MSNMSSGLSKSSSHKEMVRDPVLLSSGTLTVIGGKASCHSFVPPILISLKGSFQLRLAI